MADSSEFVSNLSLIVFNEKQKANIGAALQAVADQMLSTSEQKMCNSNEENLTVEGFYTDTQHHKITKTSLNKNQSIIEDNKTIIAEKIKTSNLLKNETTTNTIIEETQQKQHYETNDEKSLFYIKEEHDKIKFEINDEKNMLQSNVEVKEKVKNEFEIINDGENVSEFIPCFDLIKEEPQIQTQFIATGDTLSSKDLSSDENNDVYNDSVQPSVQYGNKDKESAIDYNSFIEYFCPECNTECASYTKWKSHIEKQHKSNVTSWKNSVANVDGELVYKCSDCDQTFDIRNPSRFIFTHCIKHLPNKYYLKCRLCIRRYQTKSGLHDHIRLCHSEVASCKLKKKPELKYINIFCPICQESQLTINCWWQHLAEKHDYYAKVKTQVTPLNKRMYSCKLCAKEISKEYIKYHMLYHEPHKSFQCTLCNKYGTRRNDAIQHRRYCQKKPKIDDKNKNVSELSSFHYQHKEEQHLQEFETEYLSAVDEQSSSEDSEDQYSDSVQLQTQVEKDYDQDNEKESAIDFDNFIDHYCPECNVKCASHIKWRLHIEIQHKSTVSVWKNSTTNVDGELFYLCLDCNQKFDIKNQFRFLYEHRIRHLPYKKYLKCRLCSKKFQTRQGALLHIKISHSETAPSTLKIKPAIEYINVFCPICQETQLDINCWWQHLANEHDYDNKVISQVAQLNKLTYSCKICSIKISKANIKNHMLGHEPHKSFKCTLCDEYKTRPTEANQHAKSHFSNKKKSIKCNYCEATFKKEVTLWKHYRDFHNK